MVLCYQLAFAVHRVPWLRGSSLSILPACTEVLDFPCIVKVFSNNAYIPRVEFSIDNGSVQPKSQHLALSIVQSYNGLSWNTL